MKHNFKTMAGCACLMALASASPSPANVSAEVGSSVVWMTGGRGKGACPGPGYQNYPQVSVQGNGGITLRSNGAANGNGCIWRTSRDSIDLNQVSRIELDVRTSGTNPMGQWFSIWLDPIHYVQPPPDSGEIDLIESFRWQGKVGTNFAGCRAYPNCQQQSWGVQATSVRHHITARYNRQTTRLEVYHCAYGSGTCPYYANAPFIILNRFRIGEPRYYLVADIWNTWDHENFEFSVDNIQLLNYMPKENETATGEAILNKPEQKQTATAEVIV